MSKEVPAFSALNQRFSALRMAHSDSGFNMECPSPPAKLSVLPGALGTKCRSKVSPLPCPRMMSSGMIALSANRISRIESSRAGSRAQGSHRGLAERTRKRLPLPWA